MKRKLVAVILATTMLASSLTGCGDSKDAISNILGKDESQSSDVNIEQVVAQGDWQSVLSGFKSNYANASVSENYAAADVEANVGLTQEFRFKCSERFGEDLIFDVSKTFGVYDNLDFKGYTYHTCSYENGEIVVKPYGGLNLNNIETEGLRSSESQWKEDGTWGDSSILYLVQFLDLQTGEELSKPIVTPMHIKHDLSPVYVNQSVDETNRYQLSWKEIDGATEYKVFRKYDTTYVLECATTANKVTVDDFKSQKEDNELFEALERDLINMGYSDFVVGGTEGNFYMNQPLRSTDGSAVEYVVVAVGSNGQTSGVSNVANVGDVASVLPYQTPGELIEVNATSITDLPTYIDVEMVDGSTSKMLINYHGAQTYSYTDDNLKVAIQAKVCNTAFKDIGIMVHGLTIDEVSRDAHIITERQDKLLNTAPSQASEPTIGIVEDPVDVPVNLPSVEPTPEPEPEPMSEVETETSVDEVPTPESEPTTPSNDSDVVIGDADIEALVQEVATLIGTNMNLLGSDLVNTSMRAESALEAWIASALVCQSPAIPCPVSVFPEAADLDYLVQLLMQAFRQNPSSGLIEDVAYVPELQCLIVQYVEEPEVRLNKTKAELEKAKSIADSVTNSGMDDYDKVMALNEYFKTNGTYDMDSTATGDVSSDVFTEQFIDSHTPYGILIKQLGVCESYSEAFVLAARFAGLDAICETGTIYGGPHEWNRVAIDGSWYVIDVTNNDHEQFDNALCNLSEQQMQGILAKDGSATMNSSAFSANDDSKEFYTMNGKQASTSSEAVQILCDQLSSDSKASVRVPSNFTEQEVADVIKNVMQNTGVQLSDGYFGLNVISLSK